MDRDVVDRPVLVVEDNRALAQMSAHMLKSAWQCEVLLASSLAEARKILDARAEELLIAVLDLNLPDAEMGEIVDVVNGYGVPSVVLTGTFGEEMREIILKKNVVDYVLKDSVNAYDYVTQLVGRLYKNQFIDVLVVDDSLSARAVLKHMLAIQRFRVHAAQDGREALEVLDRNPSIRLLLTDYNMPEMDGFALTAEARKRHGKDQLAIIGISGKDDGRLSAHFLKLGANDFLGKPFSYEELYCRVSQNLEFIEAIEKVRDAANRDYLTRLHNRRYFFESGERTHAQGLREGTPMVVAMMDIDHFKQVNDRYGHDGGDVALKHMAVMLANAFRGDLVARLGGEEFAVLVVDVAPDEVAQRFDAFRRSVESSHAVSGGEEIRFTVSIGLSSDPGSNLDQMIKVADERLYIAKKGGRNRVVR